MSLVKRNKPLANFFSPQPNKETKKRKLLVTKKASSPSANELKKGKGEKTFTILKKKTTPTIDSDSSNLVDQNSDSGYVSSDYVERNSDIDSSDNSIDETTVDSIAKSQLKIIRKKRGNF